MCTPVSYAGSASGVYWVRPWRMETRVGPPPAAPDPAHPDLFLLLLQIRCTASKEASQSPPEQQGMPCSIPHIPDARCTLQFEHSNIPVVMSIKLVLYSIIGLVIY